MGNQQPGGGNPTGSGGGGVNSRQGGGVAGGSTSTNEQQQQQQQHTHHHHSSSSHHRQQQQQQQQQHTHHGYSSEYQHHQQAHQQSYHPQQQQQQQQHQYPINNNSYMPTVNQVVGGHQHQHQHVINGDSFGQQQVGNNMIARTNSDASMTIMDNNALVGVMESNNNQHQNQQQHERPYAVSTNASRSSSNAGLTTGTSNPSIGGAGTGATSTRISGSKGTGTSSNSTTTTATPSGIENWLDDDTVPTVFRWEHGGRQVYITGTFNGWSRQIPMHRSGNDFTYIHNLKRGKHAFKFIVDDEWRFAPDQPTVADIEGRINNFIDVTSFKPYTGDKDFEKEKAAADYGVTISPATNVNTPTAPIGMTNTSAHDSVDTNNTNAAGDSSYEGVSDGGNNNNNSNNNNTTTGGATSAMTSSNIVSPSTSGGGKVPDRDGEIFTTSMPDMDEYTKEPPPLPPHLRHIILNKPPQLSDTAALPVPQHVALNHLYCTAIKDNMMVLGITQRYKTKYVTTVYYSPCGK